MVEGGLSLLGSLRDAGKAALLSQDMRSEKLTTETHIRTTDANDLVSLLMAGKRSVLDAIVSAVSNARSKDTDLLNHTRRVLRLRMMCLCAYSRCHTQSSLAFLVLTTYVHSGSSLLKDLVALADASAEELGLLKVEDSVTLSALASDCLVSLLELAGLGFDDNAGHNFGIMVDIGLMKSGESTGENPSWLAVLQGAVTSATATFSSVAEKSVAVTDSEVESSARYLSAGLELLSVCLVFLRERGAVAVGETASVCFLVGLMQVLVPMLGATTLTTTEKTNILLLRALHQVIVATSTCLNSRNLGCLTSFREIGGLDVISAIFEVFATLSIDAVKLLGELTNAVLESTLLLLRCLIPTSSRVLMGGNEAIVDLLRLPSFAIIFKQGFAESGPTYGLCVCIALVEVAVAGICVDPAFLGHFFRTDCPRALSAAIYSPHSPLLRPPTQTRRTMLVSIIKLTESMGITTEGRNLSREFPLLAVEAVINEKLLVPHCTGLCSEELTEMGKELNALLRERRELKGQMVARLCGLICQVCQEAAMLLRDEAVMDQWHVGSQRVQVLLKIANLCSVVEAIGSDSRRGVGDLLREILNEDCVTRLVEAFRLALPSSRQLFAQLGVHHLDHAGPEILGFYAAARPITALLKSASGCSPQMVLPVLLSSVDSCLSVLSASKREMRFESRDSNSLKETKAREEADYFPEAAVSRRTRRSRSTSGIQLGAEVLVLGVLDSVPDAFLYNIAPQSTTTVTTSLTDELPSNIHPPLTRPCYKFISRVLELDWLSNMMCHTLRPLQRIPGADPRLIISGKDVLRRLFAFHRSSLLEVCRFSSAKWQPKVSPI